MYDISVIKILKNDESLIWSLTWSNNGDFFFSSASNGIVNIWGPCVKQNFLIKDCRFNFVLDFMRNWKVLCKFNINLLNKSFRSIGNMGKTNRFCFSSFSGEMILCSLDIFRSKKNISLKIDDYLIGHYAEIKHTVFSTEGSLLITCGRDKKVIVWEKNFSRIFQCILVIDDHESDVKKIKLMENGKYIFSSTYNGVIRAFALKKRIYELLITFDFSSDIIWNIDFDLLEKKIFLIKDDGSFYYFPLKKYSFSNLEITKNPMDFFHASIESESLYVSESSKVNSFLTIGSKFGTIYFLKKHEKFSLKSKKKIEYYKNVNFKNFYWYENEIFLNKAHSENVICLSWHPIEENVLISSGKGAEILIWFIGSRFSDQR